MPLTSSSLANYIFLAPTGAQEMLISVRSVKTCLEHTIFIFWPQILQDDFMMTSRKTSGRLQTYLMLVWVLGLSRLSLMSF